MRRSFINKIYANEFDEKGKRTVFVDITIEDTVLQFKVDYTLKFYDEESLINIPDLDPIEYNNNYTIPLLRKETTKHMQEINYLFDKQKTKF